MFAVYSLIDRSAAEAAMADGGAGHLDEGRPWTRVKAELGSSSARVPLLLGDAAHIRGVEWVAEVERVVSNEGRTRVDFVRLVKLKKPLRLGDLIKASNGEPLSSSYIRPYVPCRLTPAQVRTIRSAQECPDTATEALGRAHPKAQHFVAYHNVRKNGRSLIPSDSMRFFSRKLGVLKQALGHLVWVIQGLPGTGRTTIFQVLSVQRATEVISTADDAGNFQITGQAVLTFDPPLQVNDLGWFRDLYASQRNFSLGFSQITNKAALEGMQELLDARERHKVPEQPFDVDLLLEEGQEGEARLVSHLRRERDRGLVIAKKERVLRERGRLICEACGLDFLSVYGSGGERCCEVHHINPLADADGAVVTRMEDLALLCSNCHRIVHSTSPITTVAELAKKLGRATAR
jgi:5-methylcytosine-specific restriction endonuclease McrA